MGAPHANGVPGRKFTLSSSRLSNRTSTSLITIILSAAALAAAAAAAIAVIAITGGSPARPTPRAHAASVTRAVNHSVRTTSANSASLLTTRATAAARHELGWKKEIAWRMMARRFDWRPKYQFRPLNKLWERESSWRIHAYNPYSGAYGIPQAVPGNKMSAAGPDWQDSARTQIRWGLHYIKSVYGKPRRAWAHEVAYGWY